MSRRVSVQSHRAKSLLSSFLSWIYGASHDLLNIFWQHAYFCAASLAEIARKCFLGKNIYLGCISLQVWEESFRDRLVIRPKTQHAKCGQCVKYKLLLRRLVSNPVAKRSQMAAFRQHLRQQYHDRTMYWRSCSLSRLGGLGEDMTRTISICLDSIDHSKFPLPKSAAMGSKCFAGYIKPSLTVTGVLLHGLAAFLVVGEPH